jgi:hypothetical protein
MHIGYLALPLSSYPKSITLEIIEKDDIYPGEIAERSAQEHFEDNTTVSAAITLRESHSQSAKPLPSITNCNDKPP